MKKSYDVIVVGGGLAGLCNAIHLSKLGCHVLLIEKIAYPHHKVCGEYISNEVLPYLDFLGADPMCLMPAKINRFEITHQTGKQLSSNLPLGGFGLSRYTLDNFLFQTALNYSTQYLKDTVEDIVYSIDEGFLVRTKAYGEFTATFVIGSYGKRSNIDVRLNRNFFKKNAPWLAVKFHARGSFPDDLVALHHFPGGYCGISQVEQGQVNICYLTDYTTFKKYKSIDTFQKKVMYTNPALKNILQHVEPLFKKPLTISQLYFGQKPLIENHILMSGDSGGLIHPLCGNGMAMAIRSASILAPILSDYFKGKYESREDVEKLYSRLWNAEFKSRLQAGRYLQKVIRVNGFSRMAYLGMKAFPNLLPEVIKLTHGKPITIKSDAL